MRRPGGCDECMGSEELVLGWWNVPRFKRLTFSLPRVICQFSGQ